jgi:hypothetical protein
VGTNYPGGLDEFHEPSQPEVTSLSQVGGQATPGRNHVEHHRDLGDAVQALQAHAAQRGHDHSGDGNSTTRGNKLSQANTHQNADTDSSLTAIHHTLGRLAFQAAPGNHTHDYDDGSVLNRPYIRCTSATRPSNPTPGLSIYETDTNRLWVWNDFGNGNGLRWNIQPAANIPVVRLTQASSQPISRNGTAIQWAKNVGDEDNFNYFNPSNNTKIKVTEPGVYQIDLAVQWGTNFIPEVCTVVVYVGTQKTVLRHSIFQPPSVLSVLGTLIDSDYSITVPISGKLRLAQNNEVWVEARFSGIIPIVGTIINTYLDAPSNVKSRIEMNYVGP